MQDDTHLSTAFFQDWDLNMDMAQKLHPHFYHEQSSNEQSCLDWIHGSWFLSHTLAHLQSYDDQGVRRPRS